MRELIRSIYGRISICILFTTFFIIFFSVTPSSATLPAQYEAGMAEALKSLGLFNGTGNGFDLDRPATRTESAIILLRLLGKEKESLQANYACPFKDVPDWARRQLGYLSVKQLASGYSYNRYGADDGITPIQFECLILRALGYQDGVGRDFQWTDSMAMAVSVGAMDQTTMRRLTSQKYLKRGDIVQLMVQTLAAPMKKTPVSLIQKLVQDRVIQPEAIRSSKLEPFLVSFGYLPGDQVVSFPDPSLEKAIRDTIAKPAGILTCQDVSVIETLFVCGMNVKDLSGVEFLRNLKTFHAITNPISDLSPLSRRALVRLDYLSLGGEQIVDISPLAALTNLTSLAIINVDAVDFSVLQNLHKLEELRLQGSLLKDLAPIAAMRRLQNLYLEYNLLTNIEELGHLDQLKRLALTGNQITDIHAITPLMKLITLLIADNPIADTTPLAGMYSKLMQKDFLISDHALTGYSLPQEEYISRASTRYETQHAMFIAGPDVTETRLKQLGDYFERDGYPKLSEWYPTLRTTTRKDVFLILDAVDQFVPTAETRKFWEPLLQNDENYESYYSSFLGVHFPVGISVIKDVSVRTSPYIPTEVTLIHEFIHFIHSNTISRNRIPLSLNEQIANMQSYKITDDPITLKGRMLILPVDLASKRPTDDMWTDPYATCSWMRYGLAYLYGTYGQEKVAQFLSYMANTPANIDQAFFQAFGVAEDEFVRIVTQDVDEFGKNIDAYSDRIRMGNYPRQWMVSW